MITNAKDVANRQNALKSTGPRSAAGKARSARNALKHGLTAQQVVMPDEDPAAFEALRNSLYAYYQPDGPVAEHLVEHLAACIWRLNRVPAIEAGIYSCFRVWIECEDVRERIRHETDGASYGQEETHAAVEKEIKSKNRQLKHHQPAIGRAFLRGRDSVQSLIRIASAIEGSMYRAIHELERMKAERREPEDDKPVIDVEPEEGDEFCDFE